MKIELRNVKFAAFASQETNCFEATVYIDGVKAGSASNEGHGGCNRYHPRSLEETLSAHADTLPAIVSEHVIEDDGEPFSYPANADTVIDDLFQAWMAERDLRRLLKTKAVFLKNGKLMTTGKQTPAALASFVANAPAMKIRHKADAILNALPFEEALDLYRKHG